MKLERFLVFVRILPRPGDELEQRTLFESTEYEVPIFGEFLIEAKAASFVDAQRQPISRQEIINRLWKYFGQQGQELAGSATLEEDLETMDMEFDDPLQAPLDGFWIRITGVITSLEGQGLSWNAPMRHGRLPAIPQMTVENADAIGYPIAHVLAEIVEFEVDPMSV